MSVIKSIKPLVFQWPTQNPFLFCAHHEDSYPKGNNNLGVNVDWHKRELGRDFDLKKSWKMYHGHTVPGFPKHPHRGFETLTLVLEGYVDHFDSAGSSGRYGKGDLQWMTAGSGLQHSEMFPLLETETPNPLHLFQIWLNLPSSRKFCKPYFKMFWHEDIPKYIDENKVKVCIYAGQYKETLALSPAPDSWASDADNHVNVFIIEIPPHETCEIKSASASSNRSLYLYKGHEVTINGESLFINQMATLKNKDLVIKSQLQTSFLLYLEAEPILEPVVQYGPFVMNTKEEISKAYDDYHKTQFGGWPWLQHDPIHDRGEQRIAKYGDGHIEKPNTK